MVDWMAVQMVGTMADRLAAMMEHSWADTMVDYSVDMTVVHSAETMVGKMAA